jgi:hypothetical protein
MFAGFCYDGPWMGDFLSGATRFKEAFSPAFGSGEYCHDGVRTWYWRKYPPL